MKDLKRLAFIRTLPCAKCGKHGQSEAHHSTAHGRGKAQKASDAHAFPLCGGPEGCHAAFHSLRGHFKGWVKEDLRLWQRAMVDQYSFVSSQESCEDGPLNGEEGHDVDPWGEIF